ncbi:MAG: hypothetical protein KF883_17055 [Thermomicrobiales bacterium]|nr:hypothetical protein [Thermomicrobiales bacterium]
MRRATQAVPLTVAVVSGCFGCSGEACLARQSLGLRWATQALPLPAAAVLGGVWV